MTTKSQGACLACRTRKVKCIPSTPRCARCTAMGIRDCLYTPVKKRGIGNTLRMGQACIPCRERKNKCDAKQPCTTCVTKNRSTGCKYDEGSRSSAGVPPKPQTHSQTDAIPANPGPPSPSSLNSSENSSAPPEREPALLILEKAAPVPSSDTPATEKPLAATACPLRPIVSSFEILPSIHFQTIPRPLRIPFSFIPPERVQVSGNGGSDLDMTFRLRSLCRLSTLGLYFTMEKQEALLRGDTSNTVVDRHFVYALQGLGVHVCGVPEQTSAMILLQVNYVQMAWETLLQLNETNQTRARAQGMVLATHAAIIVGFISLAQLHLLEACKIIKKGNFRFLPEYGPSPALSDQVREEISTLTQAIYLENYIYLALNGPAPVRTAGIEREFRLDLRRVYPHLFDICPLAMRTQSILLVRDAISILSSANQAGETNHLERFYLPLVQALDKHSSDLMENLQRFTAIGDIGGVATIWACCIMCLGHLAALSHLVSQTDPASSALMNELYDLTLGKLGHLFLEAHIEEYSNFDILTGMSWDKALNTIDERIELHLDTENGSLGHWKKVIGKTYTDFQANFRGYQHNSFASFVISEDGRSEGSNSSYFLLPSEREPYEF